jgi:putative transposase
LLRRILVGRLIDLIARELLDWSARKGVELRHIRPGKPDQNSYIERFNQTFREEVLNGYLFEDLEQVRAMSGWLKIYNKERPHEALVSLPPARFRALIKSKTTSTSELSA